jgi:hypothetical protein
MRDQIKLVVAEVKAAENTSAFKPAQQVHHLKKALNGAVSLLSEMASKIEALEAKIG